MLAFVKLGGSLITDKNQEATFHADRMASIASEIAEARAIDPSLQIVIGHGSGSFGHVAARKHGTMGGVKTASQWHGFAEVSRAAAQLNRHVSDSLGVARVPAWTIQPSATAECEDGVLRYMDTRPLLSALEHGVVPVVYGDVALDTTRGGTIISTETVFFYLAPILVPQHIFLFGEVRGVLNDRNTVIPVITPDTFPDVAALLGGSHGVDVTGGMSSKVRDMVRLVEHIPGLRIHILSGLQPGMVREALLNPDSAGGTVIQGVPH